MTARHISIDLETLDNIPTAVILSLGAVAFDPAGDQIGDTLHLHVDARHQPGRTISADTALWWLRQPDLARAAVLTGQEDTAPLHVALDALAEFCRGADAIWANSPSFDLAILAHAWRAHAERPPWQYWQERDVRTLKALHPERTELKRGGADDLKHHALADAIHQARMVQHLLTTPADQAEAA